MQLHVPSVQTLSWFASGTLWGKSRAAPQTQFIAIEEVYANLRRECRPPSSGAPTGKERISQDRVRNIQTYLSVLDSKAERFDEGRWTHRPRIYAILNTIEATHLMDDFIRENLTDFNLPFNEQTFPRFVDEKVRRRFYAVQNYYLTSAKDIESEKSVHMMLSEDGDKYFVPEKPLGHGGYGGVDRVWSRLSTDSFARKRVLRCRGSEQAQQYLIQELRELRKLDHRHLVKIIGSYTDPQHIAYLMKPVAEMTLDDFLSGSQSLGRQKKVILRRFYGCLAGAMNYLNSKAVRHRDLTPRNILIDSAGEVYISDFGSSYNWGSKPNSKTRHRNVPTSPDYMAPELAKGGVHGTRSDMWSLGLIYLEMTTRLLDHRLSELRKKINDSATINKVQPFPHANMPVVFSWMQHLGTSGSDPDYDREPLSWVRELLHIESEHRLTPPQLMKYIQESPSFGIFCCFKCQEDFQDDSYAYGLSKPIRKNSNDDESKRTRDTVEAFFEGDYASQPMSERRTDSIKQWIADTTPAQPPIDETPVTRLHGTFPGEEDVENISQHIDFSEQLLYNSYEYEFYYPSTATNNSLGPVFVDEFAYEPASAHDMEPVELPGDYQWDREAGDEEAADTPSHDQPRREMVVRDSGLGFLEYVSNSSDDGRPLQPFDEISDRSSINSEKEEQAVAALLQDDPLYSLVREESPKPKVLSSNHDGTDFPFDEDVDVSDAENPWDEASDRSESPEVPPQSVTSVDHDKHKPQERTEDLGTEKQPAVDQPLASQPNSQERAEDLDSGKHSAADGPRAPEAKYHERAEDLDARIQPAIDKSNLGPSELKAAVDQGPNKAPQTEKDNRLKFETQEPMAAIPGPSSTPNTPPRKKTKKKVRISAPEIVIDTVEEPPAQPTEPEPHPSRLSVSPRKRNAIVPVDVRKLMDNTWEMASSAPTSVLSEGSTSKINRFLFMFPSEQQVEGLLSIKCKNGSAHAVRLILQKTMSPGKPLRAHQYSKPFLYAIRGASSRHNKCVREFLAVGFNPNLRSRLDGLSPLHMAIEHPNFKGYPNLIWMLLSNEPPADPNYPNRNGELPLSTLLSGPDTEPLELHRRGALSMLLKAGANPNIKLPGTGNTPLHSAVRRRDPVAVAMLLYKGADTNALNNSGSTPLQVTANQFQRNISADHAEVLEHLLQEKHKVNVNQPAGAMSRTPLHWAAIAGCSYAVVRLLEAGADAQQEDSFGKDALALAMDNIGKVIVPGQDRSEDDVADHVDMMRGLVEKGPGTTGKGGWALEENKCAIETAATGDGTLLRRMLRKGLDPTKPYRGGRTIAEFIRETGSSAARQTLWAWETKEEKA